jgi:hypothetical protein
MRPVRNKATADAIVVLGCRVDDAGLPSERMRRRMALAVALYRDGAAPLTRATRWPTPSTPPAC